MKTSLVVVAELGLLRADGGTQNTGNRICN